ncbi:MAG: carbamoyltransferase HypF [gamma proteobacterium endosymbiont of Lamellibrachia anaximandri]|nr:carbamoyltransferase HypF [gamma proteobacterium endosymbiont of Lamellibrachia anaximandri]
MSAEKIRVRGLVQGVGFRPTVWRIANECGLSGNVYNDSEGVLIQVWGEQSACDRFCRQLLDESPPLARIDSLEREASTADHRPAGFTITGSREGGVHTGIVPDAATCPACRAEIFDPADRRYRYPFTNCTHCGPRLTIVEGIPYDRKNTSMRHFPMCPACEGEYADPANRRFHAQPNACPLCGPAVWIEASDGQKIAVASMERPDPIAKVSQRLANGEIVAIKGVGGFHLACDATNGAAVARLRQRKGRFHKTFALMARDIAVIRKYAQVDEDEAGVLGSPAAPILLLDRRPGLTLPEALAPGQSTLGFMLPYTPLHHLLLAGWEVPLVMTSGNLTDEPQCTDNVDAASRLHGLADVYLQHNRPIINRVDDSVVRFMDGKPRLLRRARGYAPSPIALPPEFKNAPPILALGGELKSTFCLLQDGQAILSQHLGDLEDHLTFRDYERTLDLYRHLFDFLPEFLVADLHPGYRSTRFGRQYGESESIPLQQVQHHHAHIASVLAENGWPLDGGQVVGIALDGSGFGDDGTVWGGEFLIADYLDYRRAGFFKPVPLPGSAKAIQQPWRSAFAQLHSSFRWDKCLHEWGSVEAILDLQTKPLAVLQGMMEKGVNTPLTSSCGRLFDAVAAILNICREEVSYEGQAAIELEALIDPVEMAQTAAGYPFETAASMLDAVPMWQALLEDLTQGVSQGRVAARFHRGLADAVVAMAASIAVEEGVSTVALSGGVFQNRTLFEAVVSGLKRAGLQVLSHQQVPSNDGGLSLGQAVIGAARHIKR